MRLPPNTFSYEMRHASIVPDCDFNEREFEFAFNREFSNNFHSLLAVPPKLPGPRAEKLLGYDVEHRISQGGVTHSLFLQFKVPYLLTQRHKASADVFDYYECLPPRARRSFLYFPVYNDPASLQHARLVCLDVQLKHVWYIVPRFVTQAEFETHYSVGRVLQNSAGVRPTAIGHLTPGERHRVYFLPDGSHWVRKSEPSEISAEGVWVGGQRQPHPFSQQEGLTADFLESLLERLILAAQEAMKMAPPSAFGQRIRETSGEGPRRLRGWALVESLPRLDLGPAAKCIVLLNRVFHAGWVLW